MILSSTDCSIQHHLIIFFANQRSSRVPMTTRSYFGYSTENVLIIRRRYLWVIFVITIFNSNFQGIQFSSRSCSPSRHKTIASNFNGFRWQTSGLNLTLKFVQDLNFNEISNELEKYLNLKIHLQN